MKSNYLTPLAIAFMTLLCACSTDQWSERLTGSVSEPVVQGQPVNLDTHRYAKLVILVRNASTNAYDQNRQAGILSSIDSAATEVLLSKGYAIAERTDLDKVVKEMKFQQGSGLTDSDAVSAGKMLNAQALMVITLNRLSSTSNTSGGQTTIDIAAKLVDIETASTVWQASYSDSHVGTIDDCLKPVAHGIVRSFPPATPK